MHDKVNDAVNTASRRVIEAVVENEQVIVTGALGRLGPMGRIAEERCVMARLPPLQTLQAFDAAARTLSFTAADYQETKNMENTGPVLPNTRTFHATIVVR